MTKEEITPEEMKEKAHAYAMKLGLTETSKSYASAIMDYCSGYMAAIRDNKQAILSPTAPAEKKPLIEITDEHKISIAEMYGGHGLIISDDGFWQIITPEGSVTKWFIQSQMLEWPVRVIDFLRQHYSL